MSPYHRSLSAQEDEEELCPVHHCALKVRCGKYYCPKCYDEGRDPD